MENDSRTFEAATQTLQKILREDLRRTEGVLASYARRWLPIRHFMEKTGLSLLSASVCETYLTEMYGDKELPTLPDKDRRSASAILLLKEFLATGRVITKKTPIIFDGEIGRLMEEYVSCRRKERLAEHTIYNMEQTLSRFLGFLNSESVRSIDAVRETHIIKYLNSVSIKYKSMMSTSIHGLRKFFRHLYLHESMGLDLAAFFPRDNYKRQAKLPSTYNVEEVRKVLAGVDRSTAVGKRNYPILLLAAILGLRASDIANLKFENISWENSTVRIEQQKTGKELELPLLPEIGNAIIEYLRNGRPKSESSYVFLLSVRPYTHTSQSVITQIARKCFADANINTANKHHGAHALRHTLATLLLEDRVKLPVISEVLGHSNTESTRYYLRIDLRSLRGCALDVPAVGDMFYGQKGGYFHG